MMEADFDSSGGGFSKELFYHGTGQQEEGSWVVIEEEQNNTKRIYGQPVHSPQKTPTRTASAQAWTSLLTVLETKCEIDDSNLSLKKRLGVGILGEVWTAQLWDLDVVVKQISDQSVGEILTSHIELLKWIFLFSLLFKFQIFILFFRSVRHPNCVLFIGYTKPPNLSFITEVCLKLKNNMIKINFFNFLFFFKYMERGCLREILCSKSGMRLSSSQIFSIALSVARGMNYLHTLCKPIVHGTLSSYNVLIQDNWEVKVKKNILLNFFAIFLIFLEFTG